MARNLKVYSFPLNCPEQRVAIVAATSWIAVADLTGETLHELRTYGAITDNEIDVAAATAAPGTVLYATNPHMLNPNYQPVPAQYLARR